MSRADVNSGGVRRERVAVRALAKINLTLRVLGTRPDGFHELRTTFQSLALHDTLVCSRTKGPFILECGDPSIPTDHTNLVWAAAAQLWKAAKRPGRLSGVHIRLQKRIPSQAGLGGGSSDAAAALRALALLWGLRLDQAALQDIGRALGADVAFFLEGGTMLGVERGDLLFPLAERAPAWVVLAQPEFGVSTREAYRWWDDRAEPSKSRRRLAIDESIPGSELRNDLEPVVAARHPSIARLTARLRRLDAAYAAMSGSGSAVFGLFSEESAARAAARALSGPRLRILVTRTVNRREYQRLCSPR